MGSASTGCECIIDKMRKRASDHVKDVHGLDTVFLSEKEYLLLAEVRQERPRHTKCCAACLRLLSFWWSLVDAENAGVFCYPGIRAVEEIDMCPSNGESMRGK